MRLRWWQWVVALVAIAIGSLVVVAIVKAGFACANPNKRAALKIAEATGCIEFWANRYQTAWSQGIAVAAALLAASLAWIAVQKQVAFQKTATLLAEATFWQAKSDTAISGLVDVQIAQDNVALMDNAKGRQRTGQNVHIAAIQEMKRVGQYPLIPIHVGSIGPEARTYIRLVAELESAVGRLDTGPGHSTLIDIDRTISGLFGRLSEVANDMAKARRRLEAEYSRSTAALSRIPL